MPTATTEGYCFRYSLVLMIYQLSISLHVQMQCMWLVVPDTDFCVTCSKKMAFYELHAAARVLHLHTPIHLHELDVMITYHIFSIRYCAYCSRVHLIKRIQWYSAVVVPVPQLFLSLLLQCWMESYLLPRTLCSQGSSTREKESQHRKVSFSHA